MWSGIFSARREGGHDFTISLSSERRAAGKRGCFWISELDRRATFLVGRAVFCPPRLQKAARSDAPYPKHLTPISVPRPRNCCGLTIDAHENFFLRLQFAVDRDESFAL